MHGNLHLFTYEAVYDISLIYVDDTTLGAYTMIFSNIELVQDVLRCLTMPSTPT